MKIEPVPSLVYPGNVKVTLTNDEMLEALTGYIARAGVGHVDSDLLFEIERRAVSFTDDPDTGDWWVIGQPSE